MIKGWPEIKDQVQQDTRMYWSFIRDDMAVIIGIIMKGMHYTRYIKNTGTKPTPYQLQGNRKSETPDM